MILHVAGTLEGPGSRMMISPSVLLHGHRGSSSRTCVSLHLSAASPLASSYFLSPPGTHEVVAKPVQYACAVSQKGARDQERKKRRLPPHRDGRHSRSRKSRKSTKLQSVSLLILCQARTSDSSSPGGRYLTPFESSLGQGKEKFSTHLCSWRTRQRSRPQHS